MFIQLKTRTEFTFREVFGPVDQVLAATEGPIAITDRNSAWGHVSFYKAAKAAGRKALLGVELMVVDDASTREKQGFNLMTFLAKNEKGLREIYELIALATSKSNFYFIPRIDYGHVADISDNIFILSGAHPVWGSLPKKAFIELSPLSQPKALQIAKERKMEVIATSDNYFPRIADRKVYEVCTGPNRQGRTAAMHLLQEWEWKMLFPDAPKSALSNQIAIAEACNTSLPQGEMPVFKGLPTIEAMCRKAAKSRQVDLKNKVYADRLRREIDMINEKEFNDYFYMVADLIFFAKTRMLVGPARGSSCGSLVCYLLSITDIDPIPYGLLFERFIDINRKDLPDIDIDFPDSRRDLVFEYLANKYGKENVARLGTVMRYKAKSTITDVAKELGIPTWEVNDLKDSIVERSGGDARANFCIMDTFQQLEIGKRTLEKYPQLAVAQFIENHARSSGQHAAGVVVTSSPITNYCAVDQRTGACQIDKKDAESLNLLKIDALGLRTLSVIQDTLDQIGWDAEKLRLYPTDDKKAFALLNQKKFAGIFQFEGYALQSLTGQMVVENFEDIASMTALARPGPLESGGAAEFIKRRTGQNPVIPMHPLIAHTTEVSQHIVIYQEQVMQIAREMGDLTWEDVSSLRKAMSKSLGKEFFDGYWERFKVGAKKQGVKEDEALAVWNQINTMGSWSFNRSHAVAYAMVSYWTLVLKSKFPMEFAAACLRNTKDEDQGVRLLRELRNEGFEYRAFDPELSEKNWTVKNGILIGGLLNVKGIGDKSADDILDRRRRGVELPTGIRNKLANASTPYDKVFECEERWGHITRDPAKFNITSRISAISEITEEDEGEFLVIGKIKEKDIRDLNDANGVKKRGGKELRGQSMTLNLTVEDDTGVIRIRIDRHRYIKLGLKLIEEGKIGDWYMWKGRVSGGFRSISLDRFRRLSGTEFEQS